LDCTLLHTSFLLLIIKFTLKSDTWFLQSYVHLWWHSIVAAMYNNKLTSRPVCRSGTQAVTARGDMGNSIAVVNLSASIRWWGRYMVSNLKLWG
jgi:hypothetical protein